MGDLSREDIAMAFWDVELAPFCYIDFIKLLHQETWKNG
jgi:hypothetical protein